MHLNSRSCSRLLPTRILSHLARRPSQLKSFGSQSVVALLNFATDSTEGEWENELGLNGDASRERILIRSL